MLPPMPEDELRCALVLHRTSGIGPVLYKELMAHFGTAEAVLAAAPSLRPRGRLTAAILASLTAPTWSAVDADIAWGARPGYAVMELRDPRYPYRLAQIPDPPPILFVRGDCAILNRRQIAIVGSRNPSTTGRDTARMLARDLAAQGVVITSGLAYGIDSAGHEGALEAENGVTVAVAATGLDRVYPPQHRELAHRILERGALVSEYPPGTAPLAAHFLRRNRIISGLSLGTLVVEAALDSGSLTTAQCALDQNRDVFSVPGSIYNPLARGCHALLRQGAFLVETSQDILRHITPHGTGTTVGSVIKTEDSLDSDYQKLLACFGYDPVPIDALVEQSGLTPAVVSSMLTILELRGLVVGQPGGLYTRATSTLPTLGRNI